MAIMSYTSPAGLVTRSACAYNLLNRVLVGCGTGSGYAASAIAEAKSFFALHGGTSAVEILCSFENELATGSRPTALAQMPIFAHLEDLMGRLQTGCDLKEALNPSSKIDLTEEWLSKGKRVLQPRRPPREPIGHMPEIKWEEFRESSGRVITAPSERMSMGQLFGYVLLVIAVRGTGSESKDAIARAFNINVDALNRIRDGKFVPATRPDTSPRIFDFPTDMAGAILYKSNEMSPHHTPLLQQLLMYSMFEAWRWNMGVPNEEFSPWYDHFLYDIRRLVCTLMMTPKGREQLERDKKLVEVAKLQRSLEEVSWYPPELTRRKVFLPWIEEVGKFGHLPSEDLRTGMTSQDRSVVYRERMGKRIFADTYLKEPRSDANWTQWLQWYFRMWVCGYHFGSLPARGLALDVDWLRRFFWATPDQITCRGTKGEFLRLTDAQALVSMMAQSRYFDDATNAVLQELILKSKK